jgi:hypothetical protein
MGTILKPLSMSEFSKRKTSKRLVQSDLLPGILLVRLPVLVDVFVPDRKRPGAINMVVQGWRVGQARWRVHRAELQLRYRQ